MKDDSGVRQMRLRADLLKDQGLDYVLDRPGLHPADGRKEPPPAVRESAPPSLALFSEAAPAAQAAVLPPKDPAAAAARLKAVREALGDCRRCRLCQGRKTIVFGVGDPAARLLFVGEGPGAEEDARGEPFVGRAGQLLTAIITKGMGLTRGDVYIANIVKCRPPDNRVPLPDEAAACLPFLKAQIEAVRPEVIVALGKTAVLFLLGIEAPITKLRGRWTDFGGIPVMPTFHPSYLLRNPGAKRDVWSDIQEVMRRLGLPLPARGDAP